MKRFLSTVVLGLISATAFPQAFFKGLERMCWTNDHGKVECYDAPHKWYHLNTLLMDNDSLFIYKVPVRIEKKDTLYSASDGAFYYYYGRLHQKGPDTFAHLTMYNCEYCGRQVRLDSITGYMYPAPAIDTVKVTIQNSGLKIGNVVYRKVADENDFPPRSLFYLDSTSIYRVNPTDQYELISMGIKNFLQTNELKLDNDTLRVCIERVDEKKVIETLNSANIRTDSTGIIVKYYTLKELSDLIKYTQNVIRYIEIGKITDYWSAATISMKYRILIPPQTGNFSERQYHNVFEYRKNGRSYILNGGLPENSWELIKKN